MSGFQLDTSGVVDAPAGQLFDGSRVGCIWSDLTPFAQGYVEAMLGSRVAVTSPADGKPLVLGFRHLAPATLARIIGDCEAALADRLCAFTNHPESGAMFWRERQANQLNGMHPHFPPLTPYLGDDGLIYLREAA